MFRVAVHRSLGQNLRLTSLHQQSASSSYRCVSSTSSSSRWIDSVDRTFSSGSTTNPTNADAGVFGKIAVLGGGMMAQAVVEPMIKGNIQPADRFTVYDVNLSTMNNLEETFGIKTSSSIPECLDDADMVIIAVKPQNLTEGFFQECRKADLSNDLIALSVIAGKSIKVFEDGGFTKVVRSMPNTPATIGQGMTVWSATENLTTAERKKIRQVLSSCGKSMYVDDELFIDMATSISGSGPAYIFMLMESMIDAGVHMGFPRDKATTLVYHTMLGSTLYAMESKEHPAILRNRVTSPSGTTASALYEMENGRFRTVIKDSMWACYRRSLEMGNHDSNVGPGRTAAADPVIRLSTDSDDEEDENSIKSFHIRPKSK